MNINYQRSSDASVEPVTRTEAKNWCKISTTADDDIVDDLIKGARMFVERYLRRSLITQTWVARMDEFPKDSEEILLSNGPIQSVTYIKYYDSTNTLTTFSSDYYNTDIYSVPARIRLNETGSWPDTYDKINAIEITYTAGYGAAATAVPYGIKHAILAMIEHDYDNRGDEGHRVYPKAIFDKLNMYSDLSL